MGFVSLIAGAVAITSMGGIFLGPVALGLGVMAVKRSALERDRKLGRVGAWLGGAAFVLWTVVLIVFIGTL